MTHDRYLGRRLTDRDTADVLEGLFPAEVQAAEKVPKVSLDHEKQARTEALTSGFCAPRGNRTPNPLAGSRVVRHALPSASVLVSGGMSLRCSRVLKNSCVRIGDVVVL